MIKYDARLSFNQPQEIQWKENTVQINWYLSTKIEFNSFSAIYIMIELPCSSHRQASETEEKKMF